MNEKLPYTPLSTRLSGSAKETELRLKNIFSGPKKRPPALFLALVFAVCVLCGNLVSCQNAEAKNPNSSDISRPDPVSTLTVSELSPDLNQNGIPEEIRLENAYGWQEIRFYESGQLIDREIPDVYLCRLDGTDYILRCHLDEYQGDFMYSYELARFDGEFEETQQWNAVRFDTNFNALFHREFDPEVIASFVEELNELLSHSVRLFDEDGELLAENALPVNPDWLDGFPDVFVRDPDKPLLENLRDFKAAMPPNRVQPTPQTEESLPIAQPLELIFSSGAGAWYTKLDLKPDGTFVGDYRDADGGTYYVCQFRGRFENFTKLTDSSWYMTLAELVLDTGRPVGEEWDGVPDWLGEAIHFISSEPGGFTDMDGNALKPGAGFIFYLPDATGHAPGTELYGATDFLNWLPSGRSRWFNSASDTLGRYGLYNLEAGCGFFDLHA